MSGTRDVQVPTAKMLLAGSMIDWKKYDDKAKAAFDVWNAMLRNAPGPQPDYDRGVRDGVEQALEMAVSKAVLMAGLAIEGLPETARNREAMETSIIRFTHSFRVALEALLSTPAATEGSAE